MYRERHRDKLRCYERGLVPYPYGFYPSYPYYAGINPYYADMPPYYANTYLYQAYLNSNLYNAYYPGVIPYYYGL